MSPLAEGIVFPNFSNLLICRPLLNHIVLMSSQLQEGIYFRPEPVIGNSFCLMSLRASNNQIGEIGMSLGKIWNRLIKLKKGITVDFDIDSKHRKKGNLTALLAYGSKIFDIPGSKKPRPKSFSDDWNFEDPKPSGGGSIFEGAGMHYASSLYGNHMLDDHVVIQFIADNEFYTRRACVEVWKELDKMEKVTGQLPLRVTTFYSGFQRQDQRNWLGFHDGVSNLKTRERPYVIAIGANNLDESQKWTIHGTYLAFMRISLDLKHWENLSRWDQEIIIGRDKPTGCPLVRIDRTGRPIKDGRCPVPGTSEVIDPGNEYFRDHSPYGTSRENRALEQSHIGSTRPIDPIPPWDKKSLRIFRQGFEFLAPSDHPPGFVAGLNFVSFQNTPERFFRSLTYRHMISKKSTSVTSIPTLEQFTSVLAAGIFFVPPSIQGEPFPGSPIFFDAGQLRSLKKTRPNN
jgi:Dyp-type peroxidase family